MRKCKKIRYKTISHNEPVIKLKQEPCKQPTKSQSSLEEWGFPGEYYLEYSARRHSTHTPDTNFQLVKNWVVHQRFIPQNLTDGFLEIFLSACHYIASEAIELIQKYFYTRQEPNSLFKNRDPQSPENAKIFKNIYVVPIPGTTHDGKKVIITGITEPNFAYSQLDHIKYLAMVIDFLIWKEDFGDFAIVFDGTGFVVPQLWDNKARHHKSIASLLLDTIPGTLKSFYFFFPPPHVTHVADSRHGIWITVVRNKRELAKLLSGVTLPIQFGGTKDSLKAIIEKWNNELLENRDFFISFENQMANDYRRRLCFEKERTEGGKNWVHNMKLEADEWEYKIQYYQRMKNFQPIKHRGFGKERVKPRSRGKPEKDPMEACRRIAKMEADRGMELISTKIFDAFCTKSERAHQKAEEERRAEEQAKAEAEMEKNTLAKLEFIQNSFPFLEVCFLKC